MYSCFLHYVPTQQQVALYSVLCGRRALLAFLAGVLYACVCECTRRTSVIAFSVSAAECGCNGRGSCFTTVEVDGSWIHRCNCSSPYYGDRCQYEDGKMT